MEGILHLVIRFSFNLLVVGIIVRGLYYTLTRKKNYLFSFMLIGVVVFLICYLLESLGLTMGFALGLFAIFGIIRYRTNPIPIKEMTYLFIVIGVSVVNGLTTREISYLELVFANIIIILIVYVLERLWLMKNEVKKVIDYEKIELIHPDKRAELVEDIKQRTGLPINRVEIGRINFLRDTVRLLIYYKEDRENNLVGDVEVGSLDDSRTE
ncbi:MAG: hypothetical protein AMS23_08635 [Bacteroides sp. SM1_62]|nr:MAG: hypothetical protein AMS26_09775 [Bacteroides sp. SM23_62]KPL21950.1 MAG: hypothetical protein AMS23_08635 [Bacteroides sp. SM1_62]